MTVFDRVSAVLRRTFKQPGLDVTPLTAAADVPGWDSLSTLFFIMELEAEFGVSIAHHEIAELTDIGALVALLEARL